MLKAIRGRTAQAAVVFTLVAARGAVAQDVQYKTVTRMDLGTGMNIALKLAGASEFTSTSYVKGKKMRTESDKSATIYDIERSRFIMINDANKTYIVAPLSQMTAAVREMTSSTNVRSDNGQFKATAQDSAGNKADFTFHLSVDPTNETQNVNGQDAKRAFITIETDVKVTPEGETKATDAGKLEILIDSWTANGGPAYTAVRNFQQSMSKELREQMVAGNKGLTAAFAANPEMGEAMKKAAAEQAKVDGIAMRSTMYFVLVPPSLKFDRDEVLKPQDNGAGATAKKALGGMLSGALRGAKKETKSDAPADPHQATLMKMTTEIRDVQTTSLPASLFEPPAGYREVPFTPVPTKK